MQSFGDFNAELEKSQRDWQFEIIPCPYDKTTTYGHGADKGPEAIIQASQELEFYDDEVKIDPSEKYGIKTLNPVHMELQTGAHSEPFKDLYKVCSESYANQRFPIVLGGEHSLSLGPVKAAYDHMKSQGKNLTLLHFDAHADLRQQYNANPYNHACAIYSMYNHCPDLKIVSVGIRNISQGEVEWYQSNSKAQEDIKIFYARSEDKNCFDLDSEAQAWSQTDVVEALKSFNNENFYITFDVDGFDSGIMPSTGTPEPGGLDWYTPLNIIREASKELNLIGADVVELAPIAHLHGPDFLVAKLIYKIISYKVQLGQK